MRACGAVEKGGKSGIDQQEAEDSVSEDESSDEEETTALKKKKSSWLGQMVRGVVGSSSIDMADVQQILQVKCEAWNLSRKPKQALPILDRDEFASLKNKKRSSLQGLLE